jgi:hypothetical protein
VYYNAFTGGLVVPCASSSSVCIISILLIFYIISLEIVEELSIIIQHSIAPFIKTFPNPIPTRMEFLTDIHRSVVFHFFTHLQSKNTFIQNLTQALGTLPSCGTQVIGEKLASPPKA